MAEIMFSVPEGFTPPEGIKEGQTFDFMASGYLKGKDKMCLTAVEGVAVSKVEDEENENETENEEYGMVEAVEKGMTKEEES